ncbi:MAG: hypothetical protein MJ121_06190 [Clostridia bacterium]|nr:hypothetical protein [Clostridia bacterium]
MKRNKAIFAIGVLVVLLVFLYLSTVVYRSITNDRKTVTAVVTTVPKTVDADMFIIRDEVILDEASGGYAVSLAINGEKVKAGGEIAAVFDSKESAENYTSSLALNKKLETYKTINNQVKLANLDLEGLSNSINSDFFKMLDSVYTNDFSGISDTQLSFSEKLSRKNVSLGDEVDCSKQIEELQKQIDSLNVRSPKSTIITESSGYYVSRPDGYEDILTTADVENLTEEMLTGAFEAEKKEVSKNATGKIITGYDWYIATIISSDDATDIDVGKSLTIMLGDGDNEKVVAKVYSRKALEDKRVLLVFQTTYMNEQLATIRKVNGKILVRTYRGIKMNADAVRVDENGQKGVFIREGNISKFNKIEELGYVDNYVIVKDNTGKAGWLSQYDEVFISGKDLFNGKVIS